MRLATLIALLASPALAQVPPMVEQPQPADPIVIDVYSGEGPAGGFDTQVSVLVGPTFGWTVPFTPLEFRAAKAGGGAAVLDNAPFAINGLSSHSEAGWIAPDHASGGGTNQVPGLFAVEFEVPDVPILSARMDLWFSVDESLGQAPNEGVYINEQPVGGTTLGFGGAGQNHFADISVRNLVRNGTNTLYLYMNNNVFFGGLLFHARFTINGPVAETCEKAERIHLGLTEGSNANYAPSAEGAACGLQSDRWYVLVPPISGTLNASMTSVDAVPFSPAFGLYSGLCGALSSLGCASGSTTTAASAQLPVTAGEPIFLAAGSVGGPGGDYLIDLDIVPNVSGNVYSGNGHVYVLTPTPMDIATARAFAAAQGGYLTAINDPAENAWITDQLGASSGVWIGLSDEITEGVWLWDSGEPFLQANWNAPLEPNDTQLCGGEDYVEIEGGGKWNDLASGGTPPCLCCAQTRIGLVEIPSAGLASVLQLGGNCGPSSIPPTLYSEPHRIGLAADMAVVDAPPNTPVVVFRSPAPAAPSPIGDCTIHLDLGNATVAHSDLSNAYGSISFSVLTPNDPGLIGLAEHWQAQILSGGSIYYSNGLELKTGN